MRIAGVTVTPLRIPFRVPLESAAGAWQGSLLTLVRVRSDDGAEGLGELAGAPLPGLEGQLAQVTDGLDLAEPTAVLGALDGLAGHAGHAGHAGRGARAALDAALLDLRARSLGVPLGALLAPDGVTRPEVAVNALVGRVAPGQAAADAARLVADGFACLKVKGGAEPADEVVARAAAVRDAAGPAVELRVDLNGSLGAEEALGVLERLASIGVAYVEQPLAADVSMGALATLRRRSPVLLAADESLTGLVAAQRLLDAGAADVLVIKPARVGGVSEAAAIARLAEQQGMPATISTLFESGVGIAAALHLAAGLPGGKAHGLATGELLASDLLATPLRARGGRMSVPAGAGLGVALDGDALRRYAVS